MNFEEFVVAIVAIICGTALVGFTLGKIFSLIKSWINRSKNSYDDEIFNRLAKAFTQYKKDTERRLQNLEAIIAEDDHSASDKALERPHKTIEIEDNEDNKEEDQKTGSKRSNLKNMLRE